MGTVIFSMSGDVNWYGEKVLLQIEADSAAGVFAVAQEVVDEAKLNITTNGQVDTGFMRNSGYAADASGNSTYGEVQASGILNSLAEGKAVERQAAPELDVPGSRGDAVAVAAFAADYALFQEMRLPFLGPALQAVRGRVGGIMKREMR